MRVTNQSTNDFVKFSLGTITEDLNRANRVVATEKRINTLADDPVGLTQVLNIRSSLAGIEQLNRNLTTGNSWLASSESALTQAQNLISDTKALCTQMVSSTTGASERASAAVTIQGTLDEMVTLANTEVNGRYVFSGSKTDAAPFKLESDNSVTYNGDNNPFAIKISRTSTIEVGMDGEDIFGNSGQANDIFKTLNDLKVALTNNDIAGIQQQMSRLDDHFDHITINISDVGSKMTRMEVKKTILQDANITDTERLSTLEDADITQAITDFQAKQVAYQAALASAAKVLNVSLLNYLQ